MKCDLSEFSLSLLAFSQLLMVSISASICSIIFSVGGMLLNLQVSVLSSANKVDLKKLVQFGKSLINIRKRRGPKIDPWGTPRSIRCT